MVTSRVTCLRRLDDWDISCTERRRRRRSIVAVINNPRRCSILTPCHRRWSHDCTSRACPQRLLCRQSHRCTTPSKLYDDVTTSSSEQYFGKTMLDGSPLKKKVGKVITSLQARWPRCRLPIARLKSSFQWVRWQNAHVADRRTKSDRIRDGAAGREGRPGVRGDAAWLDGRTKADCDDVIVNNSYNSLRIRHSSVRLPNKIIYDTHSQLSSCSTSTKILLLFCCFKITCAC